MSDGNNAITIAQLTEQISEKMDRDAGNATLEIMRTGVIEYQHPTEENGWTWYRKYKDGWVEQGGRASKGQTNITLLIEMADTKYFVYKTLDYGTGSVDWTETNGSQADGIVKTTTSFVCGTRNGDWQVSGLSKQED